MVKSLQPERGGIMARFTITDLRRDIVKINGWMEDEGWPERFIEQGRNGYQAVDEYSVDANGVRIGSGVNRMICGGSSRECSAAAYAEYGALHRRHAMA
jgi:hypothetical protein